MQYGGDGAEPDFFASIRALWEASRFALHTCRKANITCNGLAGPVVVMAPLGEAVPPAVAQTGE